MSFLDVFSKMNTLSESTSISYDYPYEEFLDDIMMIESAMHHEINSIKDNASINAIHALCEGANNINDLTASQTQADSIKRESIEKANEKAVKQINAQYNKVRKALDDLLKFVAENKRDINNTTISSTYTHYNGKCIKVDNVATYDKILRKFTTNKAFYENISDQKLWLGDNITVSANVINKKKDTILKNVDLLNKCITKYQETELRTLDKSDYDEILTKVKTVKNAYKNAVKYCTETKKVLNKFISYSKEGE